MSKHEEAEQARKGVIDSIKRKAKEIVGTVTGNDSLTAEGQLEQTQAQQRKEANSVEAVADAEAAQARAEAAHARIAGAQERIAVNAETAAVDNSVREQQAAQKRAAEQAAQQDAARAKTRAELDAQHEVQRAKAEEREEISAATEQAVDAAAEHQSSVQAASTAQAEADRIRRQADNLSDEADLLSAGQSYRSLMKIAEIPFVVLRFQYQIARLPLQLIEDQVAARLRSEAPARLLYERSLGALDATLASSWVIRSSRSVAQRLSSAVIRSARPPSLTRPPLGTESRLTPNWRPRAMKW